MNRRGFIVAAILYFLFFTWYHVFSYCILRFMLDESTKVFSVYYASFNFLVSSTLISSSYFVRRFDTTSIVYAGSMVSCVGTILMALAPTDIKLVIYLLLGGIFGIDLLAFFTYFGDLTVPEERGRVAGLIGSIFLPVFPLVVILAYSLDFFRVAVFCTILNFGSLAIKPLNPEKITMLTEEKDSRGHTSEKRAILLYLIPWVVFSLINATLARAYSFHISQYFHPSLMMLLGHLQVIGGGLGAIVGGVIADFLGRRPCLAFGLTLYGISSAISALAGTYEMLCLAFIGTGLTWGILLTLYSFVVWGDLATTETRTCRYSIGLATFYSAGGVGALLSPELLQIPLMVAATTSCLLIFASNLPLILAPELLPSDLGERIRVKLYISLVKRILKSRRKTVD